MSDTVGWRYFLSVTDVIILITNDDVINYRGWRHFVEDDVISYKQILYLYTDSVLRDSYTVVHWSLKG